MKKIIYTAALAFVLIPSIGFAANTYTLYRYKDNVGDNLLISQGSVDPMQNYVCSISSKSCLLTASTTLQTVFQKSIDPSIVTSFASPNNQVALVGKDIKQNGILRQYLIFTSQDGWKTFSQITTNISEKIKNVVYSDVNNNKAVLISEPYPTGERVVIFYDLVKNQEIARVTTLDNITNPVYSSDGVNFAYYVPAETNKSDSKKYVMMKVSGNSVQTTNYSWNVAKKWELLLDANRLHAFSPDSSLYAFIDDAQDFPHPKVANTSDGLSKVTDLSWPDLATVADVLPISTSTVLIQANSKKTPYVWSLYQINLPNGEHTEVVKNISILYGLFSLPNGQILTAVTEGPNQKPVIYDPVNKTVSEFTGLNWGTSTFKHSSTALTFKNGANGVLLKTGTSASLKNKPLIVWLHGGPYRQTSDGYHTYPSYATYDWVLDQVVEGGATVLKLDYPGSYGYGNAYAYSLLGGDGVIDVESVMSNIRELRKKNGMVGSVYIMGNSYGAYLGAKMITKYPSEIKEAIVINGVYEWRTLLKYLRDSIFNIHFDGLYDPINPALYSNASISGSVKKLTSKNKIMVVVSTKDGTINTDQSFTFTELLKNMNKNVEQVLLPDDDHILKMKSLNETLCAKVFTDLKLKKFGDSCKL
ncbi:MAG: prolyl oligopeptidase family serine peptidase [Candidatus Paceibacterota bacterium]|jgi:pimeloyl-ACP methyl ester carboxylesterase